MEALYRSLKLSKTTLPLLSSRYHYFFDFLAALPLAGLGIWFGGFEDQETYLQSLTGTTNNAKAASTPLGSVSGSDVRLATKIDSADCVAHAEEELGEREQEMASLSRSRSLEFDSATVLV